MATRIYRTPFAATGDKEALATADQPDGKVSLQAGWTPDYELPNDNANYRPVGRAEMNGVLSEITEGLGDVQLNGYATWQPIDGGWPVGALVSHEGLKYQSTTGSNAATPGVEGSNWSRVITTAATLPVASTTVAGVLRIATTAEAQTLVDDGTALTPKKLEDAFKAGQVLGPLVNSQKLPAGLIIKTGVFYQNTPSSANFATPFPNACAVVVGAESAVGPGTPGFLVVQFAGVTASGFNAQMRTQDGVFPINATVRYIAIGY